MKHTASRAKWPKILVISFLIALAVPSSASDSDVIAQAKEFLAKYVALSHAFDPAVAELYSDDAHIHNVRRYPTGQVREMTIPAPKYKELIRRAMPFARMRGDTSDYSNCVYESGPDGIRITCERYSNLKKYTSPIEWLVRPGKDGDMKIVEELSESQP